METIAVENREPEQRRMVSQIQFSGFDESRSHGENALAEAEGTEAANGYGRRTSGGTYEVQGFGIVADEMERPLGEAARLHVAQLDEEDSLGEIERELIATIPNAKTKRSGRYSLQVNLGKGHKWQVHCTKQGILRTQFNGGKAETHDSPQSIVEQIENARPSSPVSEGKYEVNSAALHIMLDEQHGRCALTGRELTPENVELDHLQPRSKGGEHALSNVQLVVTEANRSKGNMDLETFVLLCNDVARMHPRTNTT